jgi:hypothetical protein
MHRVRVCAAMLVLTAVLATFLSTLLCVLHCHTTLQIRTLSQAAIAAPGSNTLFICHSPGGELPAAPVPINIDALQALYKLAPADGVLFSPSPHITLLPLATLPPAAPQANPTPDTPPPRVLLI